MAQNHGATLNANAVLCTGLLAGFNYGTDTTYGTVIQVLEVPTNDPYPFSALVENLLPSTTYHYQAFAGTVLGEDMTFTTPADTEQPTVTTLAATNVF